MVVVTAKMSHGHSSIDFVMPRHICIRPLCPTSADIDRTTRGLVDLIIEAEVFSAIVRIETSAQCAEWFQTAVGYFSR